MGIIRLGLGVAATIGEFIRWGLAAAEVLVLPTPAARTYTPEAETRKFTPEAESRVYTVVAG